MKYGTRRHNRWKRELVRDLIISVSLTTVLCMTCAAATSRISSRSIVMMTVPVYGLSWEPISEQSTEQRSPEEDYTTAGLWAALKDWSPKEAPRWHWRDTKTGITSDMLVAPSREIAKNDILRAESEENPRKREANVHEIEANVHESEPAALVKEPAPEVKEIVKDESVKTPAPAVPDDTLRLLAKLIYAESNNQEEYGRRLVCDVVLNRVDHPAFEDTISGVIYEKNQFSVVGDGALDKAEVTEDNLRIAREELASRTNSEVLFFTSEGYSAYGTPWKQVQDHYFSVWR